MHTHWLTPLNCIIQYNVFKYMFSNDGISFIFNYTHSEVLWPRHYLDSFCGIIQGLTLSWGAGSLLGNARRNETED